ncbi:hypothetical protein NZK35_17410 [Stieleria sp. ICT_E10.1]|uniref:hypothetical protein n=1 Tax=Stieleria sedimenti TaxID=2976331 RepID=UPI00217F2972|nr:hypothetical protein [Stieleria sedimenti]MCS7468433.1 hypothetical protein [Stieleria sedimenti]
MDVLSHTKRFCAHGILAALPLLFPLTLGFVAPIASAPESWAQEPAAAEDAAPYIVFVAEPSAFTRCGPGTDHYRTEPLRRGQELEVYVETAEGWLGVRPPEDSFCWMPADAVELSADETTATIREDKTVAWIGTRLGKARRYRWQVQLDAGEVVFVLGKNEREGSTGSKTWLRIVPPSGEFRWIHRGDVVESAEQLAQRVARTEPDLQPRSNVAAVALNTDTERNTDADPQLASLRSADGSPSSPQPLANSTRRGTQTDALRETDVIPELKPAPENSVAANSMADNGDALRPQPRTMADRAIQFHRGAQAEDFEDSGAVIGSGLKAGWKDDSVATADAGFSADADSQSILSADRLTELPANGAAAAASAIAVPLRRMTDVVANFISPPRLVEIDSSHANAFQPNSPADRRWRVGSGRSLDTPPASLASANRGSSAQPGSLAQLPQAQYPAPPAPQTLSGHAPSLAIQSPAAAPSGVMQTGALQATTLAPIPPRPVVPSRIVTVDQIARVEDAVAGADVEAISQILSKLMAEGASADELDPLIRHTERLLRSGDVNSATRTREVLNLAQRYRNVAARRDGATTIQSASLAGNVQPIDRAVQQAGSLETTAPQPTDVSQTPLSPSPAAAALPTQSSLDSATGTATGYLVQVYSSRANSPPYALTDDAGLTIAYVTPYPGVNLRNHLNSKVAVSGNEKLLEGMSTPHILADRAIRR